VRLAKSARKQLLTAIKAAEKLQAQSQRQISKLTTTRRNVSVNDNSNLASCPRCSSSNPKGSRYCNNCGFKIDNEIMGVNTGQSGTPSPITTNDVTHSIQMMGMN
jgi:hypothetical protein